MCKLIGPFNHLLPMTNMPTKGAIPNEDLPVIEEAGIITQAGKITQTGKYTELLQSFDGELEEIKEPLTLLPGFIDCHTHICYAGSRSRDYSLRIAGKSYIDILKNGGGILDTVRKTRAATLDELKQNLTQNALTQLKQGVTTCEVKSGYGLMADAELKMLQAIKEVGEKEKIDLVSTCLAAHTLPPEFADTESYVEYLTAAVLPQVIEQGLSKRIDIFIEDGAFSPDVARPYLRKAKELGYSIVIHADQFSTGGSEIACEVKALSAEHLEASTDYEIGELANAGIIATVLPGASLGLGMQFAPARKILDKGCTLVIASDWNPGSAPMGNLLAQAAILSANEKLNIAETLAGLTYRAAMALELSDRGQLKRGLLADMIAFPTADHRDILYHQGSMPPKYVWKNGELV